MKVNITVDDELMVRIDNYAKCNYMSRSGLMALACSQYLNSQEVYGLLRSMNLAMQKIAEKGEIDDDTKAQLEDFERICSMLVNAK